MKVFKFDIWKDEGKSTKEVLVVAENEEEAEEKLTSSDLDYDNYDLMEDEEYEAVII